MKKLVILLFFATMASIVYSQNKLAPYTKFTINPNNLELKINALSQNLQKANYHQSFKEQFANQYLASSNKSPTYQFNEHFSASMPIYTPDNISYMPNFKPDSTINYCMLIKKFELHNRLEK